MDKAYRYESLICSAFGLCSGMLLKRHSDPAGLADTDKFTEKNIASIKAAVAYSMEILSKAIANAVSDSDSSHLKDYTMNVINAASLEEIDRLIPEYNDNIIKKYFKRNDSGALTL